MDLLTVEEARDFIEVARLAPASSRSVYNRTVGAQILDQFCLAPWWHLEPRRRWVLLTDFTVPGMSIERARAVAR